MGNNSSSPHPHGSGFCGCNLCLQNQATTTGIGQLQGGIATGGAGGWSGTILPNTATAQWQYGTTQMPICELCGLNKGRKICQDCLNDVLIAPLREQLVRERLEAGDTTYCKRCIKHRNACDCPEKKVLEAIKADEPEMATQFYANATTAFSGIDLLPINDTTITRHGNITGINGI